MLHRQGRRREAVVGLLPVGGRGPRAACVGAAGRQEVIDRFGPMPLPVQHLAEVAELRLAAEMVGIASISREEGQLVVRFGAGLSRATAMRLLTPGSLPGVRHADVTFASNQVRIRLPKDPLKGWTLTQAIVARLSTETAHVDPALLSSMRPTAPETANREGRYGPTERPGLDDPT